MSSESDQPPAGALKTKITVLFRDLGRSAPLSAEDRRALKIFAHALGKQVANANSFCCLITSDQELQRLNLGFRGADYPTDVLSFPTGSASGDLGEIAISLGRADAQAKEFGHSCFDELRILMLHGVLHLAGLDHERDRGEMARAERKWRTSFGLPGSLIARAHSEARAYGKDRTTKR